MNSKLLISIAVATSLVGSLIVAVPAQANEQWSEISAVEIPSGSEGVSIVENGGFDRFSTRGAISSRGSGAYDYESWFCDKGNTRSGDCNLDDPRIHFVSNAILPFCESAKQENCVESLELGPAGGPLEKASFVRHVNLRTLPEIKSQGLMAGGTTPLFESSVMHQGGQSTYGASVVAQVEYNRETRSFETKSLTAAVYGYNEKRDPEIDIQLTTKWVDEKGKTRRMTGERSNVNCIWIEQGACGVEQAMSPGVEVKLTMRVPDTFTGWFRGRLKSPEISVSKFSNSTTKISVKAMPIEVGRLFAVASYAKSTPQQRRAILDNAGSGNFFRGNGRSMTSAHWGDFRYLELFRKLTKDTAATTTSHWSFSTIDNSSNNRCLASKSRVLGIVTTNATVYNGVVPTFRNGQLSYDVAGLHYLPNGELNQGSYDLVMRSDVARCLYGFSKAPLSAKVSVFNNKGERSTATTVVGEKNGWLRLAAYGFTFSKKTIKVKLNQKPRR